MVNKDFESIYCDWREEVPIDDVVRLGRKYKHFYQFVEDDGNFIIFSDFKIRCDDEAQKLIWLEIH